MSFETILKEVKKLNQARNFNNKLNKYNETLAQLNSSIIRAKLSELKAK